MVLRLNLIAEGTGVEPVRAYAHEFSRLAHYRPAHLPSAGGACRNRTGAVGVLQTPAFPLRQRANNSYILPQWPVFNNQLW